MTDVEPNVEITEQPGTPDTAATSLPEGATVGTAYTPPKIAAPAEIDKGKDERPFDPERQRGFLKTHPEAITVALEESGVLQELEALRAKDAARDIREARMAARDEYGYTKEEAERIPGSTAAEIASNAAFTAHYRQQAIEAAAKLQGTLVNTGAAVTTQTPSVTAPPPAVSPPPASLSGNGRPLSPKDEVKARIDKLHGRA